MNDVLKTFRANVAFAIKNPDKSERIGGGNFSPDELQHVLEFLSMTPEYQILVNYEGWYTTDKSNYEASSNNRRRIIYVAKEK